MPYRTGANAGQIQYAAVPSTVDFTMCAWVKELSQSSYRAILTFGDPDTDPYGGLWTNGASLQLFSSIDSANDSWNIATDTWYFMAIIHDNSEALPLRVLALAEGDDTFTLDDSVQCNVNAGDDLYIGHGVWTEDLDGEFCYIKIWDRVLTADELMLESKQGLPVHFDNLWAHLPCFSELDTDDGTAGGDALDYSGNGRHGPISGGNRLAQTGTDGNDIPLIPYGPQGILIPFVDTGGGTTYFQTNTGGVTPSGIITRITQKDVDGVLASAGILARLTAKDFAGSLTPAGAMTRETQKSFAGSLTPTGAVSTILVFLRTITGALTPAGSITKSILKAIAGALTPTGLINRLTSVTFTGSLTPTGAITRETQVSMSGAVTPTGALTTMIVFLRAIAGALAPTGAITRETQKGVAGAVTPAGAITKETQKPVAGALTPTGAITRETQKEVAGVVTPTGDVATAGFFATAVAGVLSFAGALATLFIEFTPPTVRDAIRRTLSLAVRLYGRR